MHIQKIDSINQVEQIADAWDALATSPFLQRGWLLNWWEAYRSGCELFLLTANDENGQITGIAPLVRQHSASRGQVLRLLGSGEVCSDYMDIMCRNEHAEAVTTAMARWLVDNAPRWDLLHLDGVSTGARNAPMLIAALGEDGVSVQREDDLNCWRIALPQSWDEYLASMSKSHRKQLRRVQRRALDSGRAVLHTATTQQELDRGFEILIDLHQRRRNSLGEPGCFASEPFAAFLPAAAKALLKQNAVELHWVTLEDKPLAAEIHLKDADTAFAYQAGIDPDLMDEEPGRVIMVATIRRAIEQGYKTFDFLRGDEPYKAHWRAEPQTTVQWRAISPGATSAMRAGVWMAGDRIKSMLKTGLSLTGMK